MSLDIDCRVKWRLSVPLKQSIGFHVVLPYHGVCVTAESVFDKFCCVQTFDQMHESH